MKKKEIQERARQVLKDHRLYSVPVDPVVLANKLGIKVQNATFSDESLSGMVAKRVDAATILVNVNDPPFRKRFTIAHELGHHFLHLLSDGEFIDHDTDLFRGENEGDESMSPEIRKEVEANQFAASLLMDEELVRKYWEKEKDLDKLAAAFKVSASAMGIRLSSLGLV